MENNKSKEEPKQRLEKYSERFDNDKSAIGNPDTWGKRVLTEEDIFNQRDIDAVTDYIGKETSKQETLEDAAERLYSDKEYPMYGEIRRDGFINGAKWQQERSYSEEEVIDLLYKRSIYQDHFESDAEVREWFNKFKKK